MSNQAEHKYSNEVVFVQRSANGDVLARVTYEQFFDSKEEQISEGTELIQMLVPSLVGWTAEKGEEYLRKRGTR